MPTTHPLGDDEIVPAARFTVGGSVVDAKQFTEGGPECRKKLRTFVTVNSSGQTKMMNSAIKEGDREVCGKGQREWNCFGLPSSLVHDGKKVFMVDRLRKWTLHVNMKVRKMEARDSDVLRL